MATAECHLVAAAARPINRHDRVHEMHTQRPPAGRPGQKHARARPEPEGPRGRLIGGLRCANPPYERYEAVEAQFPLRIGYRMRYT
jgi:hypothetical protein